MPCCQSAATDHLHKTSPISESVPQVYDGDTVTLASRLPFEGSPLYRFSVRLRGIDAPEIQGAGAEQKAMAIVSRDALSEQLLHRSVTLQNRGLEKYGRLLADIYLGGMHANEWMLEQRLAVPYL